MKDGSCYSYEVSDPSGSVFRPLTRAQAMDKAQTFFSAAYTGREQEVIDRILGLESMDRMPVLG